MEKEESLEGQKPVSKEVIRRSGIKGGKQQVSTHEIVLCPVHMFTECRYLDSHTRICTHIHIQTIKIKF